MKERRFFDLFLESLENMSLPPPPSLVSPCLPASLSCLVPSARLNLMSLRLTDCCVIPLVISVEKSGKK
jgi:hypothetical protein